MTGAPAHAWSIDLSERDAGQRIEDKLAEVGVLLRRTGQLRGLRRVRSGGGNRPGSAPEAPRRQYPRTDGTDVAVFAGHDRAAARRGDQRRLDHQFRAGTEDVDLLCLESLCRIVHRGIGRGSPRHRRDRDLPLSRRRSHGVFRALPRRQNLAVQTGAARQCAGYRRGRLARLSRRQTSGHSASDRPDHCRRRDACFPSQWCFGW